MQTRIGLPRPSSADGPKYSGGHLQHRFTFAHYTCRPGTCIELPLAKQKAGSPHATWHAVHAMPNVG